MVLEKRETFLASFAPDDWQPMTDSDISPGTPCVHRELQVDAKKKDHGKTALA
jgi:hypothetical protein